LLFQDAQLARDSRERIVSILYWSMKMLFWNTPKPILTPCIGVCVLDAAGLCQGCHRSLDEIAGWSSLAESERAHLMDTVLPQRAKTVSIGAVADKSAP
jgi:predicted Fe-S protein YdhL (DUF1289 family)